MRAGADVRWLVDGEWTDGRIVHLHLDLEQRSRAKAGERLDQLGADKTNLATYNIPHHQTPQRDPLGHQHSVHAASDTVNRKSPKERNWE